MITIHAYASEPSLLRGRTERRPVTEDGPDHDDGEATARRYRQSDTEYQRAGGGYRVIRKRPSP